MRILIVLSFLGLITINSFASDKKDSLREKHIKEFPDYFVIWPILKQRSSFFDIQNNPTQNHKLTYRPNGNYLLGWGVYMFDLGFELTFSVQPDAKTQHRYGHSSVTDLQSNILGKHWGLDLVAQNYDGFYRTYNNSTVPDIIRPDVSTWNTGANGIYIFNKKKYSIRAAYNFSERQLRSGGSFLLSGTINKFSLRADSAIYGTRYENTFGVNADLNKLDFTTLSIAPGYAHTFVYDNLFANASLSIGPAQHWVYYQSNSVSKHETTLNSFIDLRVSVGYNSDRFFTGVTYITQARNVKFDQIMFTSSSSVFKIVIGYRFREFGILKKKWTDFLPINKNKN